ncbi:chaperone modulatory protein CbpM [Paracoccus isoporae]|uniref:Chaperone modulatory protein CbpM n=1 Tax=Paracoccus isoporae TaxID=591205 RepID=A0A1G7EL41_9RHOB|nr:hypothetical protein [Paracoccus isoporae]SDE64379.1 chaperone modulatory protein CbpM [Paracoccus isoporae]
MTRYTADELIAAIEDLTRPRLTHYVEMRMVSPVISDHGETYREVDRARVQLLCSLTEDYGLRDDALHMVMTVLDEMHGMRGEMQALMAALAEEPDETRERVTLRIRQRRGH